MAFVKGVSGNPQGRPRKVKSITIEAKKYTSEALGYLVDVMSDPNSPPASRVSAANTVLSYGWGRPSPMGPEYTSAQIQSMSTDELERLIKRG
jgi:hypothetical protein